MMCEKCGVNPVAVTLTKLVNGNKSTVKLCASCAQETDISKDFIDLGFSSLFSPFFEDEKPKASSTLQCPLCKITLSEFLKGKPGCASCYTTFNDHMEHFLKRAHSTSVHVGKTLGTPKSEENTVDVLKAQLKEAILTEEYEKAARIRDEIKRLEGNI